MDFLKNKGAALGETKTRYNNTTEEDHSERLANNTEPFIAMLVLFSSNEDEGWEVWKYENVLQG